MSKGIIERDNPIAFALIKLRAVQLWNSCDGKNAAKSYMQAGLSEARFLMDSFYLTNISVGDGVGLSGDITLRGTAGNDSAIKTAVKSIWKGYEVTK